MKKSLLHSMNFYPAFIRKRIKLIGILALLLTVQGCEYLFPSLRSDKITVEEASVFLENHKGDADVVLLDIRTGREFDSLKIENSVNLDFSMPDFPDKISNLERSKRYIIIDQNGRKGAMAFELMKELRFPQIHYIIGGIDEWSKRNLPLQK
ncbi:MAG TPA: rhodanese-like domain-containing protein [Ignavibacteria bacterium]|nr:rhodanese-like domain-containing protein [Ignavibacteria bacterium]HMQ98768.1 rhodanese-like domain-containing protein [Ignavibacteria bacterium]